MRSWENQTVFRDELGEFSYCYRYGIMMLAVNYEVGTFDL